MSYSSEIDGLELFTAPFRNPQAYMAAPASHPQQSKANVSPAQQPKAAASQPVKPKASETHSQPAKTHPQKPIPDEKKLDVQGEQRDAGFGDGIQGLSGYVPQDGL